MLGCSVDGRIISVSIFVISVVVNEGLVRGLVSVVSMVFFVVLIGVVVGLTVVVISESKKPCSQLFFHSILLAEINFIKKREKILMNVRDL